VLPYIAMLVERQQILEKFDEAVSKKIMQDWKEEVQY